MRSYRSRRGHYRTSAYAGKYRWGRWWNWLGLALVVMGLPLIPVFLGVPIFLAGLTLALAGLE
jgi:hypothetical protein